MQIGLQHLLWQQLYQILRHPDLAPVQLQQLDLLSVLLAAQDETRRAGPDRSPFSPMVMRFCRTMKKKSEPSSKRNLSSSRNLAATRSGLLQVSYSSSLVSFSGFLEMAVRL